MSKHAKEPKFLILEGNIGAGKSTMLQLLSKLPSVALIPEPTAKWQHVNQQENLLDLFYKDTPRWAYTFQTYAFLTRLQAVLEYRARNRQDAVHVLERSVYCDRFCFAKNCYEQGLMTPLEWHIYQEWFLWLVESYSPMPSGFIYLRTTPEVSYRRLMKRNRPEELGITLDYLKSLHVKHEQWLIDKVDIFSSLRSVPVLVLDCDKDFESDVAVRDEHLLRITDFIDHLNTAPTLATAPMI